MAMRQPLRGPNRVCDNNAPSSGPASAITPRPDMPSDNTRTPSLGAYRSRTIERAQTTQAATPRPCAMRQSTSTSMLGDKAPPRLATVNRLSPSSSTGRRPKRSAIGPQNSCPKPKAKINADKVRCAAAIEVPRSLLSKGRVGR